MRPRVGLRDVIWWALRFANLGLLVAVAGGLGVLLGTYTGIAKVIPRAQQLGDIRPGLGSRVFSAEGELLGTVFTENRQFVPLEDIPRELQDAFLAVEDREFYRHVGVDPRGIVRGILYGRGTSTITQQLVRNVYLSHERTLSRKLAEVVLAVQLERAYTKPEIMELYLNQIYFGEGAYGVQVAAKTYFGKDVSDLGLAECALLAGLPRRPEYYSPFENEERARDRRNLVLDLMASQGFITQEELAEARESPIKLRAERRPLGLSSFRAPYFTHYVLRRLASTYGADALYQGGLTIHTTLNLEMQQAAEEAVAWGIAEAKRRGFNADQAALVALDARTGAVKAMVGGAGWEKTQYNRAVQGGRQAGSAFKPFVYTAALEQGYTPQSIVEDWPVSYPGRAGRSWTPKNYDGRYHGPVTFREALAHSYNVSAVRVADMVGIGSVIDVAERMGIYQQMEHYLPLAIGYCDVSPLEMASAYAVFAARGMRTEPYAVEKVVDARGRTLEEHTVKAWRVLHPQVADAMRDMLRAVITQGTARGISGLLSFPAMGKTGTSNEYRDAWFIGFTDELSAAVWMGNDKFESTAPGGRAHGRGIAGATLPAPVWARFMVKAQPIMASVGQQERTARIIEISPSDRGVAEAPEPPEALEPRPPEPARADRIETKLICPTSGMLAGPYCPPAVEVTYDLSAGATPPTETCNIHTTPVPGEPPRRVEPSRPSAPARRVTLSICRITGALATPHCPVVVERTFEAEEAPTETCTRHGRRPSL